MTNTIPNTPGEHIRFLREKYNLSQKRLADLLHVTSGTVSKWEKDENSPNDHLSRIAEIFDVSVDYLLGREDEINIPNILAPLEYIEFFEIPGFIGVYAEIWINKIEYGESIYDVWLYDSLYGMKRRAFYKNVKNYTPALIKEEFLANKFEYIKKYRDYWENLGISRVSPEDRAYIEGIEQFTDSISEMEHELGID